MQLQVTFRNMDSSAALEARIRELVQKLQHFSSQIIRCQVVVEAPHHQHHAQGALFDFQVKSHSRPQANVEDERVAGS